MLNERQVAFRAGSSVYADLKEYLDKITVKAVPFVNTQTVSASGATGALISSTVLAGNLAIGTTTTTNGGVVAAAGAFTAGTATPATTVLTDTLGNITNMIRLRSGTTHDPITTSDNREVFGLLQAATGVVDGAAIANTPANLQVSFVAVKPDSTLELVAVTDAAGVEFQVNKAYIERNTPKYAYEGGNVSPDIVASATLTQKEANAVVTTAFPKNDTITITTLDGAVGNATVTGDSTSSLGLGASALIFNNNDNLEFYVNGVLQVKGSEVLWVSNLTFNFDIALDVSDKFTVRFKQ